MPARFFLCFRFPGKPCGRTPRKNFLMPRKNYLSCKKCVCSPSPEGRGKGRSNAGVGRGVGDAAPYTRITTERTNVGDGLPDVPQTQTTASWFACTPKVRRTFNIKSPFPGGRG